MTYCNNLVCKQQTPKEIDDDFQTAGIIIRLKNNRLCRL